MTNQVTKVTPARTERVSSRELRTIFEPGSWNGDKLRKDSDCVKRMSQDGEWQTLVGELLVCVWECLRVKRILEMGECPEELAEWEPPEVSESKKLPTQHDRQDYLISSFIAWAGHFGGFFLDVDAPLMHKIRQCKMRILEESCVALEAEMLESKRLAKDWQELVFELSESDEEDRIAINCLSGMLDEALQELDTAKVAYSADSMGLMEKYFGWKALQKEPNDNCQ